MEGIIIKVRQAVKEDLESIQQIYNEGIEDRIATLETELKDPVYMEKWWADHKGRYAVLVAEKDQNIIGWASLNPYSHRCAYSGVADLSVYIAREHRGKGIGTKLLQEIEIIAIQNQFHKIVLFTFPFNEMGQRLYQKLGYEKVGIFLKQGKLDGKFVDVMAMEKLLA
jgi:L-amino acid N-acyltransferase YncA